MVKKKIYGHIYGGEDIAHSMAIYCWRALTKTVQHTYDTRSVIYNTWKYDKNIFVELVNFHLIPRRKLQHRWQIRIRVSCYENKPFYALSGRAYQQLIAILLSILFYNIYCHLFWHLQLSASAIYCATIYCNTIAVFYI